MLGVDVVDVGAVLVRLEQEEALLVFRITEPLEVDAAGLSLAGLGVPVNLVEEGLGVLGLDVELYVDQNHGPHCNRLHENVQKALPMAVHSRHSEAGPVNEAGGGLLVKEVLRHVDVLSVKGLSNAEAGAIGLGNRNIAVEPLHAVLSLRLGELVNVAAALLQVGEAVTSVVVEGDLASSCLVSPFLGDLLRVVIGMVALLQQVGVGSADELVRYGRGRRLHERRQLHVVLLGQVIGLSGQLDLGGVNLLSSLRGQLINILRLRNGCAGNSQRRGQYSGGGQAGNTTECIHALYRAIQSLRL